MNLTLPWPPSLNHYYRSVIMRTKAGKLWVNVILSAAGRKYRIDAKAAVWSAIGMPIPILDPCSISIKLWPPDRRQFDIDNRVKALLDSLQHCGVVANDSQFHRITIERAPASDNPRVEVCVEVLQTAERQGSLL